MDMIRAFLLDTAKDGGYEYRNLALCAKPSVGETIRFRYDDDMYRYEVTAVEHVSDGDRIVLALEGIPKNK